MENKYYTPTIEEFHVGATFEYLRNGTWYEDITNDLFECHDIWKDHEAERHPVRVKYLDREDIEECGFKFDWGNENQYESNGWALYPDNYTDKRIEIWSPHTSEIVFCGTIKNKSELKRVLKMIGYGK